MTTLDDATFSYKPSQQNILPLVSHLHFTWSTVTIKWTSFRLGSNLVVCASPIPRQCHFSTLTDSNTLKWKSGENRGRRSPEIIHHVKLVELSSWTITSWININSSSSWLGLNILLLVQALDSVATQLCLASV